MPPDQPSAEPPAKPAPYAPYGQQQPYSQAAYYRQPPDTPMYGGGVTPHPAASNAMILGAISLLGMAAFVPILLAPIAWVMGGRAVRDIDRNPGQFTGRGQAQAGRIMGMIGTAVLGLFVTIIILGIGALVGSEGDGSDEPTKPDTNSDTSF